jgi:DNA-binding MarR family transcriptional regulator
MPHRIEGGRELRDGELEELAKVFVTTCRALAGIAIRSVEAAPVDVTVPQYRVLTLLVGAGPQLIGAIAEQLGVNPSNATRLCDRLQKLGLVQRARSLDDGRAVQVTITPSGRRLVASVDQHRRREVLDVLRRLTPTQTRTAARSMAAFNQAANERVDQDTAAISW